MEPQKLCLKWDGFQGSVTSVFDHLRRDSELVDVTLCCDGQRVRAHRMMLSACSPYFRELFKDMSCQQLVVFLKDTSAADLTAVVEFMYRGSVNLAESQLASFIKTAKMLQVQGLSECDDRDRPPSPAPPPPRPGRDGGQQPASPAAESTSEPRYKRRRAELSPAERQACAAPPPPPPPPPPPALAAAAAAVNVPRPEKTPQVPAAAHFEDAVKVEKIDLDLFLDDDEFGSGDAMDAHYESRDTLSADPRGSVQSLSDDCQLSAVAAGTLSGNEVGLAGPSIAGPSQRSGMNSSQADRMEVILAKILSKVEGVARSQQTLLKAVRDSDGEGKRLFKRMHSIRELEELDKELAGSPESKTAMKEYLSGLCSTDLRTSVRHILTSLFSPELARQLSAKGQNNKRGLANTHIFDVLLGTLFTVWNAPRQDVCRLVSRWLSGSRDRRAGTEPARRKRVLPTSTPAFQCSPESGGGGSAEQV